MSMQEFKKHYEEHSKRMWKLASCFNELRGIHYVQETLVPATASSVFTRIANFYKKIIKKHIYWYIEPYRQQQNRINEAAINVITQMIEENEKIYSQLGALIAEWDCYSAEEKNEISQVFWRKKSLMNGTGRVIQVVCAVNYGDAVGNDVMAIKKALDEEQIPNGIFTIEKHSRIPYENVYYISMLPALTEEDIVIYHYTSKDVLAALVEQLKCKLVIRYHNFTPAGFYEPYDSKVAEDLHNAVEQIEELGRYIDYGMTVSQYNKEDLIRRGYQCDIDVIPVLVPFQDYCQEADQTVIDTYSDGRTNVVFVGRVAPNKKFEDIIRAFAVYKERYDENARLLLVGNYDEKDKYYQELRRLLKENKIEDVIFTGHISFKQILAYYKVASMFLCMSQHEGFCVPLIEAMFFQVPIIAYDKCAVPDTMGEAGILVDNNDPEYVASVMHELMMSPDKRDELNAKAKIQLEKYQYDRIKKQIIEFIQRVKNDKKDVGERTV